MWTNPDDDCKGLPGWKEASQTQMCHLRQGSAIRISRRSTSLRTEEFTYRYWRITAGMTCRAKRSFRVQVPPLGRSLPDRREFGGYCSIFSREYTPCGGMRLNLRHYLRSSDQTGKPVSLKALICCFLQNAT